MGDKKRMTEEDIKLRFITPAITAKWSHERISMEIGIAGFKINPRSSLVVREKPKHADFILYINPGISITVVKPRTKTALYQTAFNGSSSMPGCWIRLLLTDQTATLCPSAKRCISNGKLKSQ